MSGSRNLRSLLDSKLNSIKIQHSELTNEFVISRKKLEANLNEITSARNMIQEHFNELELSLSHLEVLFRRYDDDQKYISYLVSVLLAFQHDLREERTCEERKFTRRL